MDASSGHSPRRASGSASPTSTPSERLRQSRSHTTENGCVRPILRSRYAPRPMATVQRTRLSSAVFRLPVERIREGYYSDAYFNFTKELLESRGRCPTVTMQVFQKEHSVLGGVDEAIAILKLCSGQNTPDGEWRNGWDELQVHALHEGDEIEPFETVMTIEGNYDAFAHLE